MSAKTIGRVLMVVGLTALTSVSFAKVQTLDDSDPKPWDGSEVISGDVTQSNVLLVGDETAAPNGLTITVTNDVDNALNIKTDGAASKVITMGGPLAIQAHEGCTKNHILFGNGGVAAADETSAVNLDWGALPIDIRLDSNSISTFECLKGTGMWMKGLPTLTNVHTTVAQMNGGIDVNGGAVVLDGALLAFSDWIKAEKAASTGRGINNLGGAIVCRNLGGVSFGAQPIPEKAFVRLENGGIFESKKTDLANMTIDASGLGYFYVPNGATLGGLNLQTGSILFVPGNYKSHSFTASTSGVKVVGGDGSVESQKPVAVGLLHAWAKNASGVSGRFQHIYNPYTYDAETGMLKNYDGAWSSDWENATELDNMAAGTLLRDSTVNAVRGQTLNLSGYTLEVKSGMIIGQNEQGFKLEGGTVKVGENPLMIVALAAGEISSAITTPNNSNPETTVFSLGASGREVIKGDNSSATGRFYFAASYVKPLEVAFDADNALSKGMVLDVGFGVSASLLGETRIYHCTGLAGGGTVTSLSTSDRSQGEAFFKVPTLVIGDDSDTEVTLPADKHRKIVVCKGGFVAPGGLTVDGTRSGSLTIKGDIWKRLCALEFAEDGELRIRVEKNGECTRLAVVNLTEGVTLGGTLTISEAAGVKGGVPYTILTSTGPISGKFASVTAGWKTAVVENEDGTYALTATKSASGFRIIIR